jgi:hypothetical protein
MVKKKNNVNNENDFDYEFSIKVNETKTACKLISKKFNKVFYQNKKEDYTDVYNITNDNNTNATIAAFNFIRL